MRRLILPALAILPLLPGPAAAHHPMGGATPSTFWHGLLSGLAHPVIGLDHLAFLLAFGFVAGLAGWGFGLPLLFVGASILGVASAWAGLALPGAEMLVAVSVIAVGGLLLVGRSVPRGAWAALVLLGGIAHGQAFAEAVLGAEATPVGAYLLGLGIVQAAVMGGVMLLLRQQPRIAAGPLPRVAGLAAAVVGVMALAA
ncbi:HupE/UreJ family protein [Humitalea sp. 24SJ18S-53]|uniref:HupE/UreJ family protein n=1 Tax=Humitalea sp. 24SJ18S-53 TaxID=3422307 RepID=UPI003D66D14B